MTLTRLKVSGLYTGITVSIADTEMERMRGLLGRACLSSMEALLLCPCRSIHTFGMAFAIDVLFLDQHDCVIAVHHNVSTRRVLFNLRATRTLEMAAGAAYHQAICVGDRLNFEAIP
jgi:hypothetical protein